MNKIQYDAEANPTENLGKACLMIDSQARCSKSIEKWKEIATEALRNGANPNWPVFVSKGTYIYPFKVLWEHKMEEAISLVLKNPEWDPCLRVGGGRFQSMPLAMVLCDYDFKTAFKIIDHPKFNPSVKTSEGEDVLLQALSLCDAKVHSAKWAQIAFKLISHPKCDKEVRKRYLRNRVHQINNRFLNRFFSKYQEKGCLCRG